MTKVWIAIMLAASVATNAAAQQMTTKARAAGKGALPLSTAPTIAHAGDTLTIVFRFTPEFNDEVVIQPDGHATLKSTGDIRLAGLTLPEITRALVQASSGKLVNPEITVTLKDFERPRIVVAGEVVTPGRFELRSATTALQAILLAGGPRESGSMNHVYLFRRLNSDTSEVHILQLGRYDPKTRTNNDVALQADDMILVRKNKLEKVGRFLKTFNIGLYLNPIPSSGLF